jgi:hypothetical protein
VEEGQERGREGYKKIKKERQRTKEKGKTKTTQTNPPLLLLLSTPVDCTPPQQVPPHPTTVVIPPFQLSTRLAAIYEKVLCLVPTNPIPRDSSAESRIPGHQPPKRAAVANSTWLA